MTKITTSFEPLAPDAIEFLSQELDIDYRLIDFASPWWLCVTARHVDDSIAGVLVCEFKTSFDVHCSYAISDPRCMTRRLMRAVFRALFSRAVRITSLVPPDNEHAASLARRMGFIYEGFSRKGLDGKRDALVFGMLAEDCRFLPGARAKAKPVPSVFPLGERRHGFHS